MARTAPASTISSIGIPGGAASSRYSRKNAAAKKMVMTAIPQAKDRVARVMA
jgi:hypothetical protein